jgi:NADPH:quinone reductase-like Zn-dependent oxidoreductase
MNMQAVIYERYGSPDELKLAEIARPEPRADELLIAIAASSINSRDWRMLRANPFFIRLMGQGLLSPKYPILGADLAGRVEAVGKDVTHFEPGDEVYGYLSVEQGGAYAGYACAKADTMAPKPANLSFEEAAAVPLAALTALQGLRDLGQIKAGQAVLIQGGSGGVGTFAVQLAKALGARVTAVCSTRNVDMVRGLGADEVVDYKKEDITRRDQQFDLIFAVNGYHPIDDYMRILGPDGIYVVAGGTMRQLFEAMWRRRGNDRRRQKTHVVDLQQSQEDLLLVKELLEAGQVKPVIDAAFPLSQTADAFRLYENERARGKIVIAVNPNGGQE